MSKRADYPLRKYTSPTIAVHHRCRQSSFDRKLPAPSGRTKLMYRWTFHTSRAHRVILHLATVPRVRNVHDNISRESTTIYCTMMRKRKRERERKNILNAMYLVLKRATHQRIAIMRLWLIRSGSVSLKKNFIQNDFNK